MRKKLLIWLFLFAGLSHLYAAKDVIQIIPVSEKLACGIDEFRIVFNSGLAVEISYKNESGVYKKLLGYNSFSYDTDNPTLAFINKDNKTITFSLEYLKHPEPFSKVRITVRDQNKNYPEIIHSVFSGTFDANGNKYGKFITHSSEDGLLYSDGYYVKNLKHGKWHEITKDAKGSYIIEEGYYVDGLRVGKWTVNIFDNSEKYLKIAECTYLNGKENGKFFAWDYSGNLITSGQYKNGVETGEWVKKDSEGNVIYTALFNKGKVVSANFYLWENNRISTQTKIVGGYRGTTIITAYLSENSNQVTKGEYLNNKKHGKWTEYIRSNEEGYFLDYGSYISGEKTGKWITLFFSKSGFITKIAEFNFVKNKEHGKFFTWDYEGRPVSEGNYSYGMPDGKWTKWDSVTGKIFFKAEYKSGKEIFFRIYNSECSQIFNQIKQQISI